MIHFTSFIEVATVNVSKLSLSRNNNQDANNTVNITSGEILNQSPSLARSVGIKLTLSDLALLASKGICTGGNKSFIQDCYLDIKSGFAATYHGGSVSPSTGRQVNNFQRALTGELNVLAFIVVVSAHLTYLHAHYNTPESAPVTMSIQLEYIDGLTLDLVLSTNQSFTARPNRERIIRLVSYSHEKIV